MWFAKEKEAKRKIYTVGQFNTIEIIENQRVFNNSNSAKLYDSGVLCLLLSQLLFSPKLILDERNILLYVVFPSMQ
jgi:hypothetical protein